MAVRVCVVGRFVCAPLDRSVQGRGRLQSVMSMGMVVVPFPGFVNIRNAAVSVGMVVFVVVRVCVTEAFFVSVRMHVSMEVCVADTLVTSLAMDVFMGMCVLVVLACCVAVQPG